MSEAVAEAPQPGEVPLQDIEREVSRQMKALLGPGNEPVHRARLANLIIFCDRPLQAAQVEQDLPEVAVVHPARVLLLIGEAGPFEQDIKATVKVRPIGGARAGGACSEQIQLHASGPAVDHLPFAVRSLLIGDLPTNLWWAAPAPPPLAGPMLYELSECAEQIVYDSLSWPDPARGVFATASWLEQTERPDPGCWRVASDLSWRRLKYWRRLMKQSLDPASVPGVQESVSEVIIEHGPHSSVPAWLLLARVARHLGWQPTGSRVDPGVEMAWHFRGASSEAWGRLRRLSDGPSEVRRMRITCKIGGKPALMNIYSEDHRRLVTELEGVPGEPRTLTLPPHSLAEVVGRQLSDRERDRTFRECMAVAHAMARSVLEYA